MNFHKKIPPVSHTHCKTSSELSVIGISILEGMDCCSHTDKWSTDHQGKRFLCLLWVTQWHVWQNATPGRCAGGHSVPSCLIHIPSRHLPGGSPHCTGTDLVSLMRNEHKDIAPKQKHAMRTLIMPPWGEPQICTKFPSTSAASEDWAELEQHIIQSMCYICLSFHIMHVFPVLELMRDHRVFQVGRHPQGLSSSTLKLMWGSNPWPWNSLSLPCSNQLS